MAKSPTPDQQLPREPTPDVVFHAVASLVAKLMNVAERDCQIEPVDLLTLWYVRHFGGVDKNNRNIISRYDLGQMLQRRFRLTDPQVSKMLTDLQDRGFVSRVMLSEDERALYFGSGVGAKAAVILTIKGSDKIDAFKASLDSRYSNWLMLQSYPTRTLLGRFLPVAVKLAKRIVNPQRLDLPR